MAPHISRRLVGSLYGALLPVAYCRCNSSTCRRFNRAYNFTPLEIPAGYLHQQLVHLILFIYFIKSEFIKGDEYAKALETKRLTLSYGETIIIDELNLEIPKGEITIFIGSNGCGKSTLLRSLARLLKPTTGDILLDNQAIQSMQTKQIARQMAILLQGPQAPEGLTVLQLVKQGRYPYQTWLKQWSEKMRKWYRRHLQEQV